MPQLKFLFYTLSYCLGLAHKLIHRECCFSPTDRKLFVVGLVASVEKVEFWIVELWERHAVLLSVKLSHKT